MNILLNSKHTSNSTLPLFAYKSVYVCVCMYIFIRVYVYVCMCVSVYVCRCMCICVCVDDGMSVCVAGVKECT